MNADECMQRLAEIGRAARLLTVLRPARNDMLRMKWGLGFCRFSLCFHSNVARGL